VQCSNCQEYGHTKVRCKVPPVESGDIDDAPIDGEHDGNGGNNYADGQADTFVEPSGDDDKDW
jgi:hypothetical protein